MAIGNLEIRMAHLEGGYEQINHRLGTIEQDLRGLREEIGGLRAEVREEIGGLRAENGTAIGGLRAKVAGMRRDLTARMDRQFFWMLGLLVVSILLPIVRSVGH